MVILRFASLMLYRRRLLCLLIALALPPLVYSQANTTIQGSYIGPQPASRARKAQPKTSAPPAVDLPNGITDNGDGTYSGTVMDTTFSLPVGGCKWTQGAANANNCAVNNTGTFLNTGLQYAFTNSQPGDVIELTAGARYVGNFTISGKTNNPQGKWIYVITSNYSQLPPEGTRVHPSDAVNMPKILSTNGAAPIDQMNYMNHWRFVGIEFTSETATYGCNPTAVPPINCANGGGYVTSHADVDKVADWVIWDRCYVHGSPTEDAKRGIMITGTNIAVLDSWLGELHQMGTQVAAISGNQVDGPVKINNNYLSAAGQTFLTGGSSVVFPQLFHDIEFRHNYMYLPLRWDQPGVSVPLPGDTVNATLRLAPCNIWELKEGVRVLLDGNILENIWPSCQTGFAISVKIHVKDSGYHLVTTDVTIVNNLIRNAMSGVTTLPADSDCDKSGVTCLTKGHVRRIDIKNNLFLIADSRQGAHWGPPAGYSTGAVFNPQDGTDWIWEHNTVVASGAPLDVACTQYGGALFGWSNAASFPLFHNMWINNNVWCNQLWAAGPAPGRGFMGSTATVLTTNIGDTPDINLRYTGNVFLRDRGQLLSNYLPPNNDQPTSVTYVDPANENYQLLTPNWTVTTDGKLAGYDQAQLTRAIATVESGKPGIYMIHGYINLPTGRSTYRSDAGITVSLSGTQTATTITDYAGYYNFYVPDGSYTITPSLPNNVFTPKTTNSVTINGYGAIRNFTYDITGPYSISGTISGSISNNVPVSMTGPTQRSTTTNASGFYSFDALPDGAYTITPSSIGHIFAPVSTVVTINGANEANHSFTTTPVPTYEVSGTITAWSAPQSGVTVALTGAPSTTTNASGFYRFDVPNGTYTVTPAMAGFSYAPTSTSVTVADGPQTGKNFTGTQTGGPTISGKVSGFTGVKIVRYGPPTGSYTPDGAGNFTMTGVPSGTYAIQGGDQSGNTYGCTPNSHVVTLSDSNITGIDFTCAEGTFWSLYGTVTSAGNGLNGVRMALSDANTGEMITGVSGVAGRYDFIRLAPGNYTVTPSLLGYTFSPASATRTISAAHLGGVNFTATAITTYTISGTVTREGTGPLANVAITVDGRSTTTDATGHYVVGNLGNGVYTVTPTLAGHTFSPANMLATINGNNFISDFTGSPDVVRAQMTLDHIGPSITGTRANQARNAGKPVIELPHGITDNGDGTYSGTVMDTTFSLPPPNPAYDCHPATSGQLQTCINNAHNAPRGTGITITLNAGQTYYGNWRIGCIEPTWNAFSCQQIPNPQGAWIYVISSNWQQLPPPGTRVSHADAVNMPKLVAPNAGNVIDWYDWANHWRFVGIEITTESTYGCQPSRPTPPAQACQGSALISGHGGTADNVTQGGIFSTCTIGCIIPGKAEAMPDHIIWDRVYVHGGPLQDRQRGIGMFGSYNAIIDSIVDEIHQRGVQAQAAGGWYLTGPNKIVNNYMSSSGEIYLEGGAGYDANTMVSHDTEFRHNYLYVPLEWNRDGWSYTTGAIAPSETWAVCNIFEFKMNERSLVEGNIMENMWPSCQAGYAINLKVAAAQGGWGAVTVDTTIANNLLRNVSSAINWSGTDVECYTGQMGACPPLDQVPRHLTRNIFTNNLFILGDTRQGFNWVGGYKGGWLVNQIEGARDVIYEHNTVVPPPDVPCGFSIYFSGNARTPFYPVTNNFWINDNATCAVPNGMCWGTLGGITNGSVATNCNNTLGPNPLTTIEAYMGLPLPIEPRLTGNVFPRSPPVNIPPGNSQVAPQYVDPASENYELVSNPSGTITTTGGLAGYNQAQLTRALATVESGRPGIYAIWGYTHSVAVGPFYLTNADDGGVVFTLTDIANPANTQTTTSDVSGHYRLFVPDGTYTLTPSYTNRMFIPGPSVTVTISGYGSRRDFLYDVSGAHSISGTVSGSVSSGVAVNLTGTGTRSTTTDASGHFTFDNLPDGSYTVTPSSLGHLFSPATLPVTISGAAVSAQNFTSTPVPTFAVSGTITAFSAPQSGTTVTLTGTPLPVTTTTDAGGNYSFTVPNGTYTITPTRSGFSYSPTNLSVTVSDAAQTGRNFAGTQTGGPIISGTVSGYIGGNITYSGPAVGSRNLDAAGYYSISGVPPGSYFVRGGPGYDATYTCNPYNYVVLLSDSNVPNQNFTCTEAANYRAVGYVSGAVLNNVLIYMTGDNTGVVPTGESIAGRFDFWRLSAGGSYTFTPVLPGYTFSPASRTITLTGTVSNLNFTATAVATYTISGTITSNSAGLAGVTVAVDGHTATTDATGHYLVGNLVNGVYTVTPSLAGHIFAPPNMSATINGNNFTSDFTGSLAVVPIVPAQMKVNRIGPPAGGTRTQVRKKSFQSQPAKKTPPPPQPQPQP